MKSKYGKIALIVIPVIVALFVLYPTYNLQRLEDIKNDALLRSAQADNPTDSLEIMNDWKKSYGEQYQSTRENALQLGLDLKGGMYVTLEVDVIKLIEETAQKEVIDETFEEVLEATREESETTDESVVDIFSRNFDEIARPEGKSLISYFDLGDIRDVSEENILEKLRSNADDAIEQAREVIRQRIDKYGVSEPNIQLQGNRRIILELPGVTDESQIRDLLETTARLEFKLVRSNRELVRAFDKIDEKLMEQMEDVEFEETEIDTSADEPEPVEFDDTELSSADDTDTAETDIAEDTTVEETTAEADTATTGDTADTDTSDPYEGLSDEQAYQKYASKHPFTRLFSTYFSSGEQRRLEPVSYDIESFPQGEYYFRIHEDSIPKLKVLLQRPEVQQLMPYDIEIAFSAKGEATDQNQIQGQIFDFYGLKKEPELLGDVITDASKNIDPTNNSWVVNMSMNTQGAERWADVTGANVGKRIAVVLDGNVYSAPNVNQKITGGSSQISGMANAEEANLLEIVLKAGSLKAPVKIIEEKVVGASLGEDSIAAGFNSTIFAFFLVVIFMIIYYARGGMVADISLILNVMIIFTILAAFGGTLTLPGIAGIVLTLGMAVDANILIFERVREELYRGRSLKSAIDEGFSKAMSAIIDSNITTFITGLILFFVGTGLIKGFAMTLMIGIFSTLFTAIMVSRALIELQLSSDKTTTFSFGQPKN